jgi:hypothetical protein
MKIDVNIGLFFLKPFHYPQASILYRHETYKDCWLTASVPRGLADGYTKSSTIFFSKHSIIHRFLLFLVVDKDLKQAHIPLTLAH